MPAVEDLERQPIFAGLSHDQVETLARYAEEKDVPAGAVLAHEGRYGHQVDTLGPGEFFGEIATIDGGPRLATGRAVEDSHVVVVSPRQFNEVLDDAPELRDAVMERMEERLARIEADAGA